MSLEETTLPLNAIKLGPNHMEKIPSDHPNQIKWEQAKIRKNYDELIMRQISEAVVEQAVTEMNFLPEDEYFSETVEVEEQE